MIKLKDLLLERDINESEFMKILNAAKKATGAKDKIPAETKRLCNAVQKEGFHKIDYSGKLVWQENLNNLCINTMLIQWDGGIINLKVQLVGILMV